MSLQYWEVVYQKAIVREWPRLTAAALDVKSMGDQVASSEITFDGWIKLADASGWMVIDMRGKYGIGEVLRLSGGSCSDLPVAKYQPQGLCCLEVVFQQVAVRESPARSAKPLGRRFQGEFIFACAQNADGWVKLADESGWMLTHTAEFGDLLRPRPVEDVKNCDLRVLCELWSTVRNAQQHITSSQVAFLKALEARATWQVELGHHRCDSHDDVDSLSPRSPKTGDQQRNFAWMLERLVREETDSGILSSVHLPTWQSIIDVMPEPPIRVQVTTLNGKLLDLEMDADSIVLDLKAAIAKEWDIPPSCQQLVHEMCLPEGKHLRSVSSVSPWADIRTLSVTLVVSVDALLKDLECKNQRRRLSSLKSLAALGSKGFADVVISLVKRLDDADLKLGSAAAEFLSIMKHDAKALKSIQACLRDPSPALRANALRVLALLVDALDSDVASDIRGCLRDTEAPVRAAAIHALAKLSVKDDPVALEAVLACFGDEDSKVRTVAAKKIRELAQDEDPRAMSALIDSLEDADCNVRHSAAATLPQLAKVDSAYAVSAVSQLLYHADVGVRVIAVRLLPQLRQSDYTCAERALRRCLGDPDRNVRAAAIMALSSMDEEGVT